MHSGLGVPRWLANAAHRDVQKQQLKASHAGSMDADAMRSYQHRGTMPRVYAPAVSAEPMVFFRSSFSCRSTSSGESLRSARTATCRAAARPAGGRGDSGRWAALAGQAVGHAHRPSGPNISIMQRMGARAGPGLLAPRAEALQQQREGCLTLLGWLGGQNYRSCRSLASERMALLQQGCLPHFRLKTTPVSAFAAPLERCI